jgi:hypothetical protein
MEFELHMIVIVAGGWISTSPSCSIDTGQVKITSNPIIWSDYVSRGTRSSGTLVSGHPSLSNPLPRIRVANSSASMIFRILTASSPKAFLAQNSNVRMIISS